MANSAFYCLKLGFSRCYLLGCNDGYLLIDTSYSKHFPEFLRSIKKVGISPVDIKYLLLTHHHDDHAGFAAELVKESGCRLIFHEKALIPLENGKPQNDLQPANRRVRLVLNFYKLFNHQLKFPAVSIEKNDYILTGDNLQLLKSLNIDGKILYTPGHTRDSISVILSDGSAFVGDTATNFLRLTGLGHIPILFENKSAIYVSWRRLKEHGAKIIYPSHGRPFYARELLCM